MRRWLAWGALLWAGCQDGTDALDTPCGPPPALVCVARASGPCDPLMTVPPACEGLEWRCPQGSQPRRAVPPAAACRPFAAAQPHVLGPALPVGERCLLLVDADVTRGADPGAYRAAVLPEVPTFGECLQDDLQSGPFVTLEGLPPEHFADVNAVAWGPAGTFAVHRLARRDPSLLFGVDILGAGVTRAGPAGLRLGPGLGFETDGHRALAVQGDFLYLFDAFGTPELLVEAVGLLRAPVDRATEPGAYTWLGADGRFGAPEAQRATVFQVGPQHSVTFHPGWGRWVMASVAGFGDTVFMATALRPEGPWSASKDVHRCRLPPGDPDAFCDTARVLPALQDPSEPAQVVLTYRVDTLAPDQAARRAADPQAYLPVMVWLEAE
jgi:hypothetical protein